MVCLFFWQPEGYFSYSDFKNKTRFQDVMYLMVYLRKLFSLEEGTLTLKIIIVGDHHTVMFVLYCFRILDKMYTFPKERGTETGIRLQVDVKLD